MLSQEHLTLRLVRLKPSEKWIHRANGLSFVFPKGGGGKYVSKAVTLHLVPGDVLVLSGTPEGEGGLCADEGSEMVFWFFAANFEHLFPLFASDEICMLQNVTEGFKGTKLYGASSPLARECHRLLAEVPPELNLDHRSQLLRVVAAILSVEFKAAQPYRVGFVRAEVHMIQVFEKLPANELLSLSVGELAAKFGCSKRHLNRLFHQHFGFSVAAMRMEMRLLKAASLLRDPDTKVINVAEQCGFNHLGLFNTCFKRRFGASPGLWRKMSAQAEGQSIRPVNDSLVCPLQSHSLCPWVGNFDNCQPAEGGASKTQKAGSARLVINVQIPGESVGHKPAASQRKIAGIAGRKNLLRPGSLITKKSCSL
jgi:AraC-like DNA-binding protein